jgi:hypothetical protein
VKTERDPVTPDEYVLRRIPNLPDWIDESLAQPVQRLAFQPNQRDTKGLSVFRELFVTPAAVAAAGRIGQGYYVVRLLVKDLLSLELSVVADPQEDQLRGHALIPELSSALSSARKAASKILQRELAKLASEAIVHRPN